MPIKAASLSIASSFQPVVTTAQWQALITSSTKFQTLTAGTGISGCRIGWDSIMSGLWKMASTPCRSLTMANDSGATKLARLLRTVALCLALLMLKLSTTGPRSARPYKSIPEHINGNRRRQYNGSVLRLKGAVTSQNHYRFNLESGSMNLSPHKIYFAT